MRYTIPRPFDLFCVARIAAIVCCHGNPQMGLLLMSPTQEEGNIGGEDILPLWFCTMALPVLVYAQVHLLRSFPEQ